MQLVYIVHEIYKALEEGREMRAVFLDISKAFDRVWHRGLIAKLRSIGVEGNLLNWFISYLQVGGGGEGGRDEVWDRETMFSQLAKRSPCVVVSG